MKKSSISAVLLLVAAFIMQSFDRAPGGDLYRIYLNDKMVLEQFVTLPQQKHQLTLTELNEKDRMVVYYSHCGSPGTARSVQVKDSKGAIIKQWKYMDTKEIGLQVAVKELLPILEKNGTVTIHYASAEVSSGKLLAALNPGKTVVAKR